MSKFRFVIIIFFFICLCLGTGCLKLKAPRVDTSPEKEEAPIDSRVETDRVPKSDTVRQDTPQPILLTGMHTETIGRIDLDGPGKILVTGSDDKSVRVWDTESGTLLKTLYPPIGDGNEGKIYAVAISPDGSTIAAGGWTGYEMSPTFTIYIFDRQSGRISHRITGLPNAVLHLSFSPDGGYLAAAMGGNSGIHIFNSRDYTERTRLGGYEGDSYWVHFSPEGGLVSTCLDGYVRLYGDDFFLISKQKVPSGALPFSASFSPDGKEIAVGFLDSTIVHILSGKDLSHHFSTAPPSMDNGDLAAVAWSETGEFLYAAGKYRNGDGLPIILKWDQTGRGTLSRVEADGDIIIDIRPIAGGALAYASSAPSLGLLDSNGDKLWTQFGDIPRFHDMDENFQMTADGTIIKFSYGAKQVNQTGARKTALLDLNRGIFIDGNGRELVSHIQKLLAVKGFETGPLDGIFGPLTEKAIRGFQKSRGLPEDGKPTLDLIPAIHNSTLYHPRPKEAGLSTAERKNHVQTLMNDSPSGDVFGGNNLGLALTPDEDAFLVGTDGQLGMFDSNGSAMWRVSLPASVRLVNITGDSRLAVAALGDGTLRWYDLKDGRELLAFYFHTGGKGWAAWLPEGFYNAGAGGCKNVGYYFSANPEKEGAFIKLNQLAKHFFKPDLPRKRLQGTFEDEISRHVNKIGKLKDILQIGLPPRVVLETPEVLNPTGESFELSFSLENRGGGMGSIEYRVNGSLISTEHPDKSIGTPSHGDSIDISKTLIGRSGANKVSIIAYNQDEIIASEPVSIQVNIDHAP